MSFASAAVRTFLNASISLTSAEAISILSFGITQRQMNMASESETHIFDGIDPYHLSSSGVKLPWIPGQCWTSACSLRWGSEECSLMDKDKDLFRRPMGF